TSPTSCSPSLQTATCLASTRSSTSTSSARPPSRSLPRASGDAFAAHAPSTHVSTPRKGDNIMTVHCRPTDELQGAPALATLSVLSAGIQAFLSALDLA